MTTQVAEAGRTRSDARLGFGVASASAATFLLFVVAPFYVPVLWELPGTDPLWVLGALVGLLLGPVAAGLAAWASFTALWSRGDRLPASSRRLHLLTMVIAAALFFALLSPWGAELSAFFRD